MFFKVLPTKPRTLHTTTTGRTTQVLTELGLEADMAMASAPSAIKGKAEAEILNNEEQGAMDVILKGMPELNSRKS
jgi:hypothetical protein